MIVELIISVYNLLLTRSNRTTTQMTSEVRATHSHSTVPSAPTRLTTMAELRCKTLPR
jgi:hypothetical protein